MGLITDIDLVQHLLCDIHGYDYWYQSFSACYVIHVGLITYIDLVQHLLYDIHGYDS